MKKAFRVALSCVAVSGLLAGGSLAAEERGTPKKANAGFDLMQALVGNWEMPAKEGTPTTVSYSIVSEGTALMEQMGEPGKGPAMVTMYHPDGDQLLMTHYCGANNQPRMRCDKPSADGKSLTFEFVDGTNFVSTDTGHMHRLVIRMPDPDHLVQEWTWKEGKKMGTDTFTFTRKKA